MDYLVVDEVQDLAPLTIQLLLIATKENVFFCGDTAQTIAKGVTFRFHDLKPAFINRRFVLNKQTFKQDQEHFEPKVIQLTKNYRSHNNILQLANSIVDIVELYFPHTIDKLQRESSDKEGPKPIILEGFSQDDLEKLVMTSSASGTPMFGSNQVIIVRNQEMKNKIPFFMKKALCLTVYEAKGLEFDDVILYDFFSESQCQGKWRIINDVEVESVTQQKLKIQEHLTIDELDYKNYNKLIHRLRNEEYKESDELEYEEVSVLNTVKDREDVDRNFGILNNELKYLYVSVTRPKTNLIIYDSDPGNRKPIYDYWTSLGLVNVVTKGQEDDHPVLSKAFEASGDIVETKSQWRALGIKLFKKKYYQAVIKCFEESGDEDLKLRTYGFMYAEEATQLESEGDTLLYRELQGNDWYVFNLAFGKGKELYQLHCGDQEELDKGGDVFVPMQIELKKTITVISTPKVDHEAREILQNETNQTHIVKFFEGLEQYGIKFSENQKNMLVANTNTLVLGRSGTGKTTISAFKILALDLLFIAYKKKHVYKEETYRLKSSDFKEYSGCHTIFCTASPVLTNEVKRFYHDLIQSITKVLKVKEQKREERRVNSEKHGSEEELKEETKEEDSKEPEQEAQTEDHEKVDEEEIELTNEENDKLKEAMIQSLEKAKEDLLEDMEIEKQLTSYNTMDNIPEEEFPLFLTVKKLVYMLDGSCSYPFFSRNSKGKIIGMDSSNEWHNESKEGSLMINQYQKDTYDFDQTIKNLGREMIQADDMEDEEKIKYLQEQGIQIETLEDLINSQVIDSDSDDDVTNMQDFLENKKRYQ